MGVGLERKAVKGKRTRVRKGWAMGEKGLQRDGGKGRINVVLTN